MSAVFSPCRVIRTESPTRQAFHLERRLWRLKVATSILLGSIWLIEGFSKLISLHPRQIALVERSGLFLYSGEWTLALLGILEIIAAVVLFTGYRERAAAIAVTLATIMFTIIVPVNDAEALWDPFGGVVKNLALMACGIVIWVLAPFQKTKSYEGTIAQPTN